MIYLVTQNKSLFASDLYKEISLATALSLIEDWDVIQFDTETGGRNCHLVPLLCMQFGNKKADTQIVVDCTDPKYILAFKKVLEDKLIIGQNLKFDLQFLYNYNIVPVKVYDTMIAEQVLYLGYPVYGKIGGISYSLKALGERYLGIDIDKSTRGEIIWRGLDSKVILYAAGDVQYLEDIKEKQEEEAIKKDCVKAVQLECNFVPVVAYMEWCGIKLDQEKWQRKMIKDLENLNEAESALNNFAVKNPVLKKFTFIETQGDLFSGFDLTPKCSLNWSSSSQVIKVAKLLGFNTTIQDKKTGEDKDSVLEKELSTQRGINDEFLDLYFKYQEYSKLVSSFGQGHLNAVNPLTGRIHTTYKQLGAASGRMSCGSSSPDTDLAAFKKIKASDCKYPNIQQLPHDEFTRSCFVSEEGNKWVSCDYSAKQKLIPYII